MSQARQDHSEWGFDNPSVGCVFLFYKFYYKGTISGFDIPFRELCVPLLQVLLQGDDLCPRQATTTLSEGSTTPP